MQIKHLLGMSVLAATGQVGAVVTDGGANNALDTAADTSQPGSFADTIRFSQNNDAPLTVTVASAPLPMPEPKPTAMALSALAIMGLMYRRKRQD